MYSQNKKSIIIIRDYLFIYLLIGFSGINFFFYNKNLLVTYFLLLSIIFFLKVKKIHRLYALYIFLVLILTISQYYLFNYFALRSLISTIILISCGYFIVKIVGSNYIKYYINIIYYLAFLNLIIYIFSLLFPGFFRLLNFLPILLKTDTIENQNFLIYTVESSQIYGLFRNSGFVYEPGIYACFLIPALFFNSIQTRKLFTRKNIIFFISILSTFSTAGYSALIIFLLGFITIIKNKPVYYLLIPFIIWIAFIGFTNLNFMEVKIQEQIEISGIREGDYSNKGRIGSALIDWKSIVQYPFTGKGRNKITRFDYYQINSGDVPENIRHRTNGLFDLMAEFGIPFAFIYLLSIFISMKKYSIYHLINKKIAYIALMLIIILGFSQTIFMRPFFLSLIFIGNIFKIQFKPIPEKQDHDSFYMYTSI